MNAQQLSRRHVMQLAAGALASAGLVRGSLAASGSNTRAKAIIIYFSRTGTTKGLAEAAAAATGADLLELTLKDPYADDYSAMTGIARSERANNARREIAAAIPDLSGYDAVVIGSPYWWGGLSIPMRTFLMDHPLAGKRVLPFCVSASSSPSGAWADVRTFCPNAQPRAEMIWPLGLSAAAFDEKTDGMFFLLREKLKWVQGIKRRSQRPVM